MCGFEQDTPQNRLRPVDVDRILDVYQRRKQVDRYAYIASFSEIKENDFSLSIPRYVDTFQEPELLDISAIQTEIEGLREQLAEAEAEMALYLMELGYGG